MLSQMVQTNPQLREMLANPDFMRTMMTPENIQAAMGLMGPGGGLGGMGAMSG